MSGMLSTLYLFLVVAKARRDFRDRLYTGFIP